MKKILHIIAKLSPGGTELKLLELIKNTKSDFHHEILVISNSDSELLELFKKEDVKVSNLNIFKISSLILSLAYLNRNYRNSSFNLIVGWLYHGNFLTLLIQLIQKEKSKVVWNIRSSTSALKNSPIHRKIITKILNFYSRKISSIIYNSLDSKSEHREIGFENDKTIIIENGIDTNKFQKDPNAKKIFCKNYNIPPENFIVGIAARNHPIKNYDLFLSSVLQVLEKNLNITCLICGTDTENLKKDFFDKNASKKMYEGNFLFLGFKENMPFYYSVMDLLVLTSDSESSSNVIAEAMSCECLAVSTDVGNSKKLIDDESFIIGNKNEELKIVNLTNKILELSNAKNGKVEKIRARNRRRIKDKFSLKKMIISFKDVFNDLS